MYESFCKYVLLINSTTSWYLNRSYSDNKFTKILFKCSCRFLTDFVKLLLIIGSSYYLSMIFIDN